MQYSLADALNDESLPYWWTESDTPDWARDDRYRDIDCPMLILEIRRGWLTQEQLNVRLSHRRYNAKKRVQRIAAEARLTPEEREAKKRRKSAASALQSRKNRVTLWRNKLADALARKAAGDGLFASIEADTARRYLADADARLSEYLARALADEFARINP